MSQAFPWYDLGILPTADAGAIRKAYAARLRAMDPDLDPDAYARLRQARDHALQQAKRQPPQAETPLPEPDQEPDDAPVTDPVVPPETHHTAPLLTGHEAEAAGRVCVPLPVWQADAPIRLAPDCRASSAHGSEPALPPGPVFAVPVLDQGEASHPVQRPEVRLRSLLIDPKDQPLSEEDEAEARACLRALLAQAAHGRLDQREGTEIWLASLFSASWPRCAPLLEETAEALGWTRLAGQLGESRDVAFLNERLAGYLFQRDVQLPSHPFHKAWRELSRPGPAGALRHLPPALLPRKREIRDLLMLIRSRYPELESLLDAQRVGSWDRSMATRRRLRLRLNWLAFGCLVLIRVLIALNHDDGTPAPPITPTHSVEETLALNKAIALTFGSGMTLDALSRVQPDLASWIDREGRQQLDPAKLDASAARLIDHEVRNRIDDAMRDAGGPGLDDQARTHLALIGLTRQMGGDACTRFLRQNVLPAAMVWPKPLLEHQQQLADRLAQAGKLSAKAPPPGTIRVTIPGAIMGRVIAITGLGRQRVETSMQDVKINADRCAVQQALFHATLDWHGPEREQILKVIL
ncbi:hypothetical protein [Novosphingobium terrae]|uniref:hypothetical protein n=1 Tax=Novosphingobium terrae TaxID=2726189 RepID=UPI0019823902|nr:hypothetical protein [Novosphingobium terrae]